MSLLLTEEYAWRPDYGFIMVLNANQQSKPIYLYLTETGVIFSNF